MTPTADNLGITIYRTCLAHLRRNDSSAQEKQQAVALMYAVAANRGLVALASDLSESRTLPMLSAMYEVVKQLKNVPSGELIRCSEDRLH